MIDIMLNIIIAVSIIIIAATITIAIQPSQLSIVLRRLVLSARGRAGVP